MPVQGLQFGVAAREGGEPNHDLRAGLVDEGRHDTVFVLPGERVRIAVAFEDFDGLYMAPSRIVWVALTGFMQRPS